MKRLIVLLVLSVFACITAAQSTTYLVQKDETLLQILVAQGFPESYALLEQIIEETIQLNPHVFFFPNPDLLSPGDELVLPINPFPRSCPIQFPEVEIEILSTVDPVARVVITKGSYVVEREGVTRDPSVANSLFVGDTLVTQAASVVRVQFIDQSVFSIGSESRFFIEDFSYPDARPESGFRASLRVLLGAVSGISGLVGSDDRDQHSITTPLSVIGLRGTEYTLRHCELNCGSLLGTSLAVTDGVVALTNAAGEAELNQGEFVQATSANEISPITDIPEGFLDLEADPAAIEVQFSWWQRLINLFR